MNESSTLSPGEERITGIVEKVNFFSESSGFSVLRLSKNGERDAMTVVGYVAAVNLGQHVEAVGCWHNDKTRGLRGAAPLPVLIAGRS